MKGIRRYFEHWTRASIKTWRASRLKVNLSQTAVAGLVFAGMGLIRVSLLTRTLGIEDYGRIVVATNLFFFLALILKIRVGDLLFQFIPTFEADNRDDKVEAILQFSLLLCIGSVLGLLIVSTITALLLFRLVYHDAILLQLCFLFLPAGILIPLEEFSSGRLRLQNRFLALLIPQMLAATTTVALLIIIWLFLDDDPRWSVSAIAIGAVLSSVCPFVNALKGPVTIAPNRASFPSLADDYHRIRSTLLYSTSIGLLKSGSSDGGLFLLGIIGGPEQTALYGFATQVLKPLQQIQNIIGQAINPELVRLWSQRRFQHLYDLATRTVRILAAGGSISMAMLVLVGPLVVASLAGNGFRNATPVIWLLALTQFLTLASLPFFMISLAMERLPRRNFAVSVRLVYLAAACGMGLNAVTLAGSQLLGAFTVRLLSDYPILTELRSIAQKSDPVIKGAEE